MRVLFLACCVFALLACSDPQCGTGERKLGVTCIPVGHDGGAQDAGLSLDASNVGLPLDAGRDLQNHPDAAQALQSDAGTGITITRCGDGNVTGAEVCDSLIAEGESGSCPTQASCKSSNACLTAQLTGSASTCDAVCTTAPLTECHSGDGCCPAGCKKSNDADCSSSCGDGVIDASEGETCEAKIGAGCPTSSSCRTADPCSPKMLTGSAENCNAACIATAITATSGATTDGCCPPGVGATYKSDHDCAGCGDQVVQAPELCDGNCPSLGSCDDSNPCTRNALGGSADTCDAVCTFPPITASMVAKDSCCPAGTTFPQDLDCPGCGNGVLEAGEQCDDGNPDSHDGCDSTCNLDDNTNTPGDDRPGRTVCGGQKASCDPGELCVEWDGASSTGFPRCQQNTSFLTRSCDGPEDCVVGQFCCSDLDDEGTTVSCASKTAPCTNGGSGTPGDIVCHLAAKDCPANHQCVPTNSPHGATYGVCR